MTTMSPLNCCVCERTLRSRNTLMFSCENLKTPSPQVDLLVPFDDFGGNDPNWGRIIMAIGKTDVNIEINKLSIKLGYIKIIEKGQLIKTYIEDDAAAYMKEEKKIDIDVDLNLGKKNFTAYTMDLTKEYIEINADYRS